MTFLGLTMTFLGLTMTFALWSFTCYKMTLPARSFLEECYGKERTSSEVKPTDRSEL